MDDKIKDKIEVLENKKASFEAMLSKTNDFFDETALKKIIDRIQAQIDILLWAVGEKEIGEWEIWN